MALLRPQFSSRLISPEISSTIPSAQIRNDALLEGFSQGATHWQSLTAMSVGGVFYRVARSVALPAFASLGLPLFSSRPLSSLFALGVEVGAFEGTHRGLSVASGEGNAAQLFSWSGSGGLKEGLSHSFLTFGVLKSVGAIDLGRDAILHEVSQDLAMILSHRVAEVAGLQARENKGFAEEFLEAACVNLQMRVGQHLGHAFLGGALQRMESVAERNYRQRAERGRVGSIRETAASMSLEMTTPEMERSLGLDKKWNLRDYQTRMIFKLREKIQGKISSWLGLASPMQTGKSYLTGPAIEMMQREFGNNTRFIILTSSKVTTMQIIGDLLTHFKYDDIGRFDAEVKQTNQSITVASVYSLHTHLSDFTLKPGEKVVIVNDEAYFTQAPIYRAIYEHFGMGEVQEMDGRMLLGPKENPRGIVLGLSGTGAGLEGYEVSDQLGLMEGITKGWIRDLHGERLLLKRKAAEEKSSMSEPDARETISTQEVQEDGEDMIWWEPTLENAQKLRQIYHEKIFKKHFQKPLIFVPTIEHGNVLMAAFNAHYGRGNTYFVHSEQKKKKGEEGKTDEKEWSREDRDMDVVLEAWRNNPNQRTPLISVNQLSRGFRGKGTGAVFHTYQTNSMELFSQRTGRAWAMEPTAPLGELYVLEVAWSRRVEFASLARLLGLLDYPRSEFRSKGIQDVLGKIERKRVLREKMEVEVDMGRIEDIFLSIPILESWRADYDAIVRSVGTVNELSRTTGIAMETLAGFALGALPTLRWQVEALSPYLGGRERAIEKWVQVWRDVVDEWFAGGQSLEGKMTEELSQWVNHEHASVSLQAEALEQILRNHFHDSEKQVVPIRRGVYRLMAHIREMYPTDISDANLQTAIMEERAEFEKSLGDNSLRRAIFEERLMRRKVPPAHEVASRFEASASTVATYEKQILNNFAREFVRRRFLEKGGDVSNLSLVYVVDSRPLLKTLTEQGHKNLGDLMRLSPQAYYANGELSAVLRNQLDIELRKTGVCVGSARVVDTETESAQLKALDEVLNYRADFVSRETGLIMKIARRHDIFYIGDLVRTPVSAFESLPDETYLKLMKVVARYDLALGMQFPWLRPGDRREVPEFASRHIMESGASIDAWKILKRTGIHYMGDAARLTPRELSELGLSDYDTEVVRDYVYRHLSLGLKLEAWTRPEPLPKNNQSLASIKSYHSSYFDNYVSFYLKCKDLEELAHYSLEGLRERGVPEYVIKHIHACLLENGYDFGTGIKVRPLPFNVDTAVSPETSDWSCRGTQLAQMLAFHQINTWRDLLALSEADLARKFPREIHQRQIRWILAMRGFTVGMPMEDFPAPRAQLVEVLMTIPMYNSEGVECRLFEWREEKFFRRREWSHLIDVLRGLQGKPPPAKFRAMEEFAVKLNRFGLWYSDSASMKSSWKPAALADNHEVAAPATMSIEEYLALPTERLNDLIYNNLNRIPSQVRVDGVLHSIRTLRDIVFLQEALRVSDPSTMSLLREALRDIGFEMKARADYDPELFRSE